MAQDQLTIEVTLTQPTLGLTPYVLVQVDRPDDALAVTVESGGGVPQDREAIVELLNIVVDVVSTGTEQS